MRTYEEVRNLVEIYPISAFTYWFTPAKANDGNQEFYVYALSNKSSIGYYNPNTDVVTLDNKDSMETTKEKISYDFKMYQNRPEYIIATNDIDFKTLPDMYNSYLLGAIFYRYFCSGDFIDIQLMDDVVCNRAEKVINWLRATDFYTAPASTQYHDSNSTGLIRHILNVVTNAYRLYFSEAFGTVYAASLDELNLGSIVLCALVHDWGKINRYSEYQKNVKDDDTGKWYQVAAFKIVDQPMIDMGDGVSAMFIANKFFKLTMTEASAIRWHNGRWLVSEGEIPELRRTFETNPLSLLLHTADMLALSKFANPFSSK